MPDELAKKEKKETTCANQPSDDDHGDIFGAQQKKSTTANADHTSSPQKAAAGCATSKASVEEEIWEDIDLTHGHEPEYETINHSDASHSSYNSQADHARKYPRGFGSRDDKGK